MSDTAPAIPFFGDAYLADTRHLSLEEHGAYLQLMMIAWRSPGCALPDDDARIARMLGITAGRWAKLKPSVMGFWTLGEQGWTQKRLSKEHAFVEKKRAQNFRAANSRWGKQPIEKQESDGCERTSERNAPPPPPNKAAKAASESDAEIQRVVGTAYRAARAAGCCSPDQRKIIENQTIVRQWIAAGATHDGIVALIEERMAGASITPRSLRYFDAAIRESLEPPKPVRSRQEAEALALADRILSRPQEPRRAAG